MDMLTAFNETIELAEERGMPDEPEALGLAHIRDMYSRINDSFSEAKLGRWLGWAQCAVVASGVATLEEMKALNRKYSD